MPRKKHRRLKFEKPSISPTPVWKTGLVSLGIVALFALPVVWTAWGGGGVAMEDVLADNPLPDLVMGRADAPVTVVEYASMTCVHCASFQTLNFPTIKRELIDTGKVRWIHREFPLDQAAAAAAMLARCVPERRYHHTVDELFKRQREWVDAGENRSAALKVMLADNGLQEGRFETCLADEELQEKVWASREKGEDHGVSSTPTFVVDGRLVPGSVAPAVMAGLVDEAIAAKAGKE